jgi:hypothetical protein
MAGARHFTELIVWQLGDQHRAEIFKLTKRPGCARILSSARSSMTPRIPFVATYPRDSAVRAIANLHDSSVSADAR